MSTEIIHLAGRYNKYRRNLSQSPWIDKDDVRVKNSVQELIEDGISKYLNYESLTFASCGREDVDVRMLGKGRPFVFKIHNAQEPNSINDSILRQVENFINSEHGNDIKVRDLQLVTKTSVAKHLNEGQEFKSKEYRALCCCSRKLTCEEIEKINNTTELNLEQKTPIRVLHRRTLATRSRKIHRLRIDPVELGQFDCVKSEDLDHVFALTLVTEAGTYIKEFVHGDFGRTEPNLSSLIGGQECETDLIELDVMEVYVDWPPELKNEPKPAQTCPASDHQADRMDKSEEALAETYSKALKAMEEAELMPRGDDRQNLYIRSRQMFQKASELVESIALFSDNETIDDIATADLRYLLIPAYQAKIFTSAECSPNRLDTFTQAETLIIKFFTRLLDYGLANEQIERAIKSDESTISVGARGQSTADLQTAMRERNEKIEKFKRMKVLESRLDELERRIKSGEEVDDEIRREYYLKLINKWTEDSLESLEREVRPAIFFERNRPTNMEGPIVREQPHKAGGPSSGLTGKPYTIVKNELQKQVFGLGYPSRPTVTVDEFISKKINDGDLAFQAHKEVYSNSLQRYAEDPGLRRDQEEKSDEERDAKEDCDDAEELKRKRNWDEFKDDNPRGSGNRHNMG